MRFPFPIQYPRARRPIVHSLFDTHYRALRWTLATGSADASYHYALCKQHNTVESHRSLSLDEDMG